jgi:hypothetical protein
MKMTTKILVFAIALFTATVAIAEEFKELQMNNDADGIIAITVEECLIPSAKAKGFDYRSYATEDNGTVHEGCWMEPDMSDAPESNQTMRIIPIVNIYFDGMIMSFDKEWFKPESSYKNPKEGEIWI